MTAPRHITSGRLARLFDVAQRTVCKWVDRDQLPGEYLPGTKYRRVRLEDALAFARECGLPHEELERLCLRAGLAVASMPTLLIYSPCPTLLAPFAVAGFEAIAFSDPWFAGHMLHRRSYQAVLIDQAVGTSEARTRLVWLRRTTPDTRLVLLASEDDGLTPRAWGVDDYWRRPVDLHQLAEDLLTKLRPGRRRTQSTRRLAA